MKTRQNKTKFRLAVHFIYFIHLLKQAQKSKDKISNKQVIRFIRETIQSEMYSSTNQHDNENPF